MNWTALLLSLSMLVGLREHPVMARWDVRSGELPQAADGWQYYNLYACPDPKLSRDGLRIDTLAHRDIYDRCWYENFTQIAPPRTFIVEARVRVLEIFRREDVEGTGAQLGIAPRPGSFIVLNIEPGRVLVDTGQHTEIAFVDDENGTGFHTYRVEVRDDRYALSVDGADRCRGPVGHDRAFWTPEIWWGDLDNAASATSDWVYVEHNAGKPHEVPAAAENP